MVISDEEDSLQESAERSRKRARPDETCSMQDSNDLLEYSLEADPMDYEQQPEFREGSSKDGLESIDTANRVRTYSDLIFLFF